MLVVISYDITDSRRLARVAKELENYGTRVQKSVFECYVDEDRLHTIRILLSSIIDMETDHIRYYRICGKDEEKIVLIGNSVIYRDYDYFVV